MTKTSDVEVRLVYARRENIIEERGLRSQGDAAGRGWMKSVGAWDRRMGASHACQIIEDKDATYLSRPDIDLRADSSTSKADP